MTDSETYSETRAAAAWQAWTCAKARRRGESWRGWRGGEDLEKPCPELSPGNAFADGDFKLDGFTGTDGDVGWESRSQSRFGVEASVCRSSRIPEGGVEFSWCF